MSAQNERSWLCKVRISLDLHAEGEHATELFPCNLFKPRFYTKAIERIPEEDKTETDAKESIVTPQRSF